MNVEKANAVSNLLSDMPGGVDINGDIGISFDEDICGC